MKFVKRRKDIWDVTSEIRPEDVVGVERRNLADALFKAVVHCAFHRVRFMLHNGVAATVINDADQNLLIAALYIQDDVKRDRMFQLLIGKGADVCHVDRNTGRDVLAWAAYLGRADQVQFILDAVMGEIDLQRRDLEGMTPLHQAVIGGHTKVVEILVAKQMRYGLAVDIADDSGLTPYIYARRLARPEIAQVLLDQGNCSRHQLDSVTFRSADEWAIIGRQEKQQRERERAQREKLLPRLNKSSRLPQLKAAKAGDKQLPVSIVVESDEPVYLHEDHKLIDTRASTAKSVDIASHEASVNIVHGASSSLPTFSSTTRTPFRIVASSADSAERLIALTHPKPLRPSSGQIEAMLEERLQCAERGRERKPIRDDINDMLELKAVQCCQSFRSPARLPTPPEERMRKLGISTLAVVLGAKKQHKQDVMTSSRRSVAALSSMATTSNKFVENMTEKKRRKTLQLPSIA